VKHLFPPPGATRLPPEVPQHKQGINTTRLLPESSVADHGVVLLSQLEYAKVLFYRGGSGCLFEIIVCTVESVLRTLLRFDTCDVAKFNLFSLSLWLSPTPPAVI